ncbi:DJ-1 family glyoxalase III [Anaerococcus sp. AGMB09787]|uniref:DJ-1 family glyoxalase III n=1 Tax=Anaerococcus sp. AGMB09787 TaxID=2922869 RepID=UPI001FAEA004|nr:DJ-1 family glyoxalase III [Anaerococcus sp. AGMB09787]
MDKFLILVADGNETIEILTVYDYLKRSDVPVDLVSTEDSLELVTSHGLSYKADFLFDEINPDDYFGVYIPGGTNGAIALRDNDRVINLVKDFDDKDKIIAAICAGPIVLNKAGVLEDKRATSHPVVKDEMDRVGSYVEDEFVVTDGNITTSRGAALTNYLALRLVEIIKGEKAKEELKPKIMQSGVEDYYSFKF